ncbi:isochorismate synthase MenF [Bacteroidota bacterium]
MKLNYPDRSSKVLISCAIRVNSINFNTLLNNFQNSDKKYFYWAKSIDRYCFLGYDHFMSFNTREDHSESGWNFDNKTIKKSFYHNWTKLELDSVPLIMGGLKFTKESPSKLWNDYSYSNWFIPRIIYLSQANRHFIIFNFFSNEDLDLDSAISQAEVFLNENESPHIKPYKVIHSTYTDNDFEQWSSVINDALKNISDDKVKKIVISREVSLEFDHKPHMPEIIEKLGEKYPDCYIFIFRSGNSIFFGASPEKLLTIKNNHLETAALAGSIKRGISKSDDELLAKTLLSSTKNLAEQKAVTEFVINAIAEHINNLSYEKNPVVKKLENIQHLWTPITGELKPDISIFDIIQKLHPTPAVCGVPCSESLRLIDEYEDHSRGLYSGVIGWLNFENEADLAVGIRSALLNENKLYAYSGCGIVEGSDPSAEYEESNLKLKPILSLFENGIIG